MTDIVDTIDAALHDYEVSGDAMRCSPDAAPLPPVEERRPAGPPASWPPPRRSTSVGYVADFLADQRQLQDDYIMSMLLFGQAFIEEPVDGRGWGRTGHAPRVIPPERVVLTGPQGIVAHADRRGVLTIPRARRYRIEYGQTVLAEVTSPEGGTQPTRVVVWTGDDIRSSFRGARVDFCVFDEACPPDPQEDARRRALEARLNRHTGPQQNRHRHRGL